MCILSNQFYICQDLPLFCRFNHIALVSAEPAYEYGNEPSHPLTGTPACLSKPYLCLKTYYFEVVLLRRPDQDRQAMAQVAKAGAIKTPSRETGTPYEPSVSRLLLADPGLFSLLRDSFGRVLLVKIRVNHLPAAWFRKHGPKGSWKCQTLFRDIYNDAANGAGTVSLKMKEPGFYGY